MAHEGFTKAELDAIVAHKVLAERERCAKIADERTKLDQLRYRLETDWRMPYALNRVIRASIDIAVAIRSNDDAVAATTHKPKHRGGMPVGGQSL